MDYTLKVNSLINSIRELRSENVSDDNIFAVKNSINDLLAEMYPMRKYKCDSFYYTHNTDNVAFGLVVIPKFKDAISKILLDDDRIEINKFSVELDSKMFDYGLSDEQVVTLIMFNVLHLLNDNVVDKVRDIVTDYLSNHDQYIKLDNNQNSRVQLLDFGIYDTICQLTSPLQIVDEEVVRADQYLSELELYELPEAINIAYKKIPGCTSVVERSPKLNALDWCFRIYSRLDTERVPAVRLLNKMSSITGSVIYKAMIRNALLILNTISTDSYIRESALQEGSLLQSIKYNGLRGLENDLYEFMLRARNADTEDEVMYALKQINTRLTILDDYIWSNDGKKDPNRDRWQSVYDKYIAIRDEIAAKKVYNKRNYGIFVDYDKIDKTDNPNGEDYSL